MGLSLAFASALAAVLIGHSIAMDPSASDSLVDSTQFAPHYMYDRICNWEVRDKLCQVPSILTECTNCSQQTFDIGTVMGA